MLNKTKQKNLVSSASFIVFLLPLINKSLRHIKTFSVWTFSLCLNIITAWKLHV